MGYSLQRNRRYRMPTHFGPAPGPRQRPDGGRYSCLDTPKQTIVHAGFQAEARELSRFLPQGFRVREPCRIDFSFVYMSEIEWLAGRGYNTFGISTPASFTGEMDEVQGDFLFVLWENMTDPIITGREELGFSKVYCELPPLRRLPNQVACMASWDNFKFATLDLSGLTQILPEDLPPSPPSAGLLHYKYMPRTGEGGEPDACYATFTPAAGTNLSVKRAAIADVASCRFKRSSWEDLPTLAHIVNALAELSIGKCIAASVVDAQGAKDLGDQRILK